MPIWLKKIQKVVGKSYNIWNQNQKIEIKKKSGDETIMFKWCPLYISPSRREKQKQKQNKTDGIKSARDAAPSETSEMGESFGHTYLCVRASKHGQGAYCRLNKSSGDPTARPPSSNEAYSTVAKSLNL